MPPYAEPEVPGLPSFDVEHSRICERPWVQVCRSEMNDDGLPRQDVSAAKLRVHCRLPRDVLA